MAVIPVRCPCCDSDQVVKRGKTDNGKQRYQCQQAPCARRSFILEYTHRGYLPSVKQQIIDLAMNGSGIRDTARVLGISPDTVLDELKNQESQLEPVNRPLLAQLNTGTVTVIIRPAEAAEVDEMWSYVGSKANPRWLWHAIDHYSGKVLAYVFGRRKDAVFLELKGLLEPFGIQRFYTDDWGAYERHLAPEQHVVGKRHTQRIERKHLTLRTRIKRLARQTICFSKSTQLHDIVIGLFVNRYEFGLAV